MNSGKVKNCGSHCYEVINNNFCLKKKCEVFTVIHCNMKVWRTTLKLKCSWGNKVTHVCLNIHPMINKTWMLCTGDCLIQV